MHGAAFLSLGFVCMSASLNSVLTQIHTHNIFTFILNVYFYCYATNKTLAKSKLCQNCMLFVKSIL